MSVLSVVEDFVRTMHQGQVRRNREDYANHPIRVANALIKDGYHKACIVGMLHDVVEDCGELRNLTVKELYLLCDQFLQTKEEKEALSLVTKLEGETSKDQVKRIALSGNQLAMLVKKYDAIDNSIMTKEDEDFTWYKLGKDPIEEIEKYKSIVTNMDQELKYLEMLNNPLISGVMLMDFTNSGYLNSCYVINKNEFNDIRKKNHYVWNYYHMVTPKHESVIYFHPNLEFYEEGYSSGIQEMITKAIAILNGTHDWWSEDYNSVIEYCDKLDSYWSYIGTAWSREYGSMEVMSVIKNSKTGYIKLGGYKEVEVLDEEGNLQNYETMWSWMYLHLFQYVDSNVEIRIDALLKLPTDTDESSDYDDLPF